MKPAAVITASAISGLGRGEDAYRVPAPGAPAESAIFPDADLIAADLAKPRAARASITGADRAPALLTYVAGDLAARLDREIPSWRDLRVGLVLGTSSGGLESQSRALDVVARGEHLDAELARGATYFAPLRALAALGVVPVRSAQVLAACASSTVALGLGARWLDAGEVDLVIAGGYDAVSRFVAAGFEAIGATSASPMQPFRVGRAGMSLGEGAALIALAPDFRSAIGYVLGFGAASDAVHATAPDPEGRGLERACLAALGDAGLAAEQVDVVSAHATATPYNDSAEGRAIAGALGAWAPRAVVHAFKASIGHTLGAAGALETLAVLSALRRRLLPASLGSGALDPELTARLCEVSEVGEPRHALKLSAAFGGANAALVVGRDRPERASRRDEGRVRRSASVAALGPVAIRADGALIAAMSRMPSERVQRLDPLSALVATAVASLVRRRGVPLDPRAGVIVGTTSATLEANAEFAERPRARGARSAEPRRFPATSPNLAPGQCSIAFGVVGPAFAVGSGPDAAVEAVEVALDLVRAGDAPEIVVVAAELGGDVTSAFWRAAGWVEPEAGARALIVAPSAIEQTTDSLAGARSRARAGLAAPGHGLWAELDQ